MSQLSVNQSIRFQRAARLHSFILGRQVKVSIHRTIHLKSIMASGSYPAGELDPLRMRDRVAIVTGGSSGIGEGIVKLFVKHGCNVVFCSNQEKEGKTQEAELNKSGPGKAHFVKFSATNEDDVKNVINVAVQKFKKIDCLINNVGQHPHHKDIDDFSTDEFRQILEINVISHFTASKYALPYLRQTKGSIVNVASMVATLGQKGAVTYCATKGAVVSMTKALAIDEAPYGVRVNCISPGNIWTPLWKSLSALTPDQRATQEAGALQQVLGRFGTPDECAQVCLFLATDATYLTGLDIPVTGGSELDYGIKAHEKKIASSRV